MERAKGKRRWVKMYPQDCLFGSINYQLEPAQRCVWYELIYFSALCSTPGVISDKDNRPYPRSYIANRLNVPLELLEATLAKCIEEGRIQDNNTGLHITNWKAYQSEYQRQKPSREARKLAAKTFKECPDCHFLVEVSKVTEKIEICPQCKKRGKEVKLETRQGR